MLMFGWFWVLVALLIVVGVLIATIARDGSSRYRRNRPAEQVLAEGFASGEVTAQEYDERGTTLGQFDPPPHPASKWPVAVAIGLIVTVGGGLMWAGMGLGWGWGHMGWGQSSQTSGVSSEVLPDAPTVQMTADDLFFQPASVEITAGEPVTIIVTNEGRVFHDLTIPQRDITIAVDPGQTVRAGLQIDEPGEYDFLCTVPGHADAGMRGTVLVN